MNQRFVESKPQQHGGDLKASIYSGVCLKLLPSTCPNDPTALAAVMEEDGTLLLSPSVKKKQQKEAFIYLGLYLKTKNIYILQMQA